MNATAQRRLIIAGIVLGAILTLAPVLGLLGTAFGMTRAFSTLGNSGISDPRALSESIGTTLLSTAAGFFLFPLGIVVLAISLVFYFNLRASTPPPLPRQRAPQIPEARHDSQP